MKKSIVIALHVGYWLAYLLFSFVMLVTTTVATTGFPTGQNVETNFAAKFLLMIGFGLLYFYTFYLILVPKFLARRKIWSFVVWALGVSMFAGPIIFLISFFTIYPRPDFTDIEVYGNNLVAVLTQWGLMFIFSTFLGLINGMLGALLKGFITWYDEIHLREVLIRKNVQTELALLKAQLNPHFLFNTLNNIDVLIEQNAKAASAYLKKLSDILRFMLYDTREEKIPLSQELEYIGKFIDLQSIRTANEKFVSYEVNGGTAELFLAPMLFVPFIENAFKHSTNKRVRDAITIRVDTREETVTFWCRNVVDQERSQRSARSGLGIELIKQRLQLLYERKHLLTINQTNEFFDVSLTLDLHAH